MFCLFIILHLSEGGQNVNRTLHVSLNKSLKSMENKLALRTGSGIRFICYDDIIYCKADGRYTQVFLRNGKSVITARLLKSFEHKLPDDMFLRIHKSHIINLRYITNYSSSNNGYLVLGTNTRLDVSKRKRKSLLEKLDSIFTFV